MLYLVWLVIPPVLVAIAVLSIASGLGLLRVQPPRDRLFASRRRASVLLAPGSAVLTPARPRPARAERLAPSASSSFPRLRPFPAVH